MKIGSIPVSLLCAIALALLVSCGSSTVEVKMPNTGDAYTWTQIAEMPKKLFESGTAVVDGKLYVFGGYEPGRILQTTSYVFDPEANAWTRLADLPSPANHWNAVVDGRNIWYAGGFKGNEVRRVTDEVWRYDIDTDTFNPGPPLPEPRGGGALARVGRNLHYFGGVEADLDTDSETHWTLTLDNPKRWEEAPPFPRPRNHFSVAVVGTRIYAIGGGIGHDSIPFRGPYPDKDWVDVFDAEVNEWREGPTLTRPLSHAEPGTFVLNDWIVVGGGRAARPTIDNVIALDPERQAWIELPPLPQPLHGAIFQRLNNSVVCGGGRFERGDPIATMWEGDLTGPWERLLRSDPE